MPGSGRPNGRHHRQSRASLLDLDHQWRLIESIENLVERGNALPVSGVELPNGGERQISYAPVDTSLIPVRPRTYGLEGAEIIEEVWREKYATPTNKLVHA